MSVAPLQALPLELLRQRSSTKWRSYGDDVIPMFVAETDFALAPAITAALARAVEIGDTGYTPPRPGIDLDFADFAERRWGWRPDPARIRWTGDVMMGVVEVLRAVSSPGDRVVVTPPVYPPFYDTVEEAGAVVERVPLRGTGERWELDLDGIAEALASGARAVLLCNPHNPTGTVHTRESLAGLARLAHRYGATVVSDEIHAPLTHAPAVFTPFLDAAPEAAAVGYTVTSASKTYNLAGLKCAVIVTGSDETAAVVRALPWEVEWRAGLFGVIANRAAFATTVGCSPTCSPSTFRSRGTVCPRRGSSRGSMSPPTAGATTRRRSYGARRRSRCITARCSVRRVWVTCASTWAVPRRFCARRSSGSAGWSAELEGDGCGGRERLGGEGSVTGHVASKDR